MLACFTVLAWDAGDAAVGSMHTPHLSTTIIRYEAGLFERGVIGCRAAPGNRTSRAEWGQQAAG